MAKLMDIVLPVLLLGGGLYIFSKRCELLGVCGTPGSDVIDGSMEGGVDESASNQDAQGNWDDANAGNKGCCECSMQGDRVKCQRHGGAWFNPPAVGGVSNDQSVELSLQACNADCGTSATPNASEREKIEVKTTKCPPGYNNVNGKCQKQGTLPSNTRNPNQGSGTGKATGTSGTQRKCPTGMKPISGGGCVAASAPKTTACPAGQVRNKLTGKCNRVTTQYTQYRSYFVDPNYVRPFTLYHRIAN